jgi:hypothetical protein
LRSDVFSAFAEADRERIPDWEPRTLNAAFLEAPFSKCGKIGLIACAEVLADACGNNVPVVLGKATLTSLLTMLQSIAIGQLGKENADFVEQLEHTLVAIVQDGRPEFVPLASSCLVCLALNRGSAAKLLRTVHVLLSSPISTGFRIPRTMWDFESYAKSIAFPGEAMPWVTGLLSGHSVLDELALLPAEGTVSLLAAGNGYLYLQSGKLLQKIATGYVQ